MGKRIKDTNTFSTLSELIEHLSKLPDVAGIVEYGGRTYMDMTPGGDYDLTVIFNKPISKNFGGVHFHVSGIPVDCMLLSIDDFISPEPASPFYLVHLNCNLLYDSNGTTKKLLDEIKLKWKKSHLTDDCQKSWSRFVARHTLDKLEHRLFDNEIYSRYLIMQTADLMIETYAEFKELEVGKPKVHLSYMKQNDPFLYNHFETLYKTVDLSLQFDVLKKINAYLTKDIGGIWGNDEVLFHLLPDGVNDDGEQKEMLNYLFEMG